MTLATEMADQQNPVSEQMMAILDAQRTAFLNEGFVTAETRIDRLNRGIAAIAKHQERLIEAMDTDFNGRPRQLSMILDIAESIGPMKKAAASVRNYMKADKRKTIFPLNLLGGRSRVEYQPLGVVGIISPWNFPVCLAFDPLAQVLAAGNRAIIKPSEYTPTVSQVMAEIVQEAYDETEVAVVTGGPEVGAAFSELPFDHMVFTGATSIARHVMAAAAKNLVPVTLELGGKSPVIISRNTDIKKAASRIMMGKAMNAGQICLAPDYLLVPEEKLDEMVAELQAVTTEMYPTLLANQEYTSIINERHYQRLQENLADARAKGADVIEINPANESFDNQQGNRKIPPVLIKNPSEDMRVMEEEIFGPLLPIKTYKDFDETIRYINSKPRPLALYYFGDDAQEEREVLDRTTSGGVCLNDVIMHSAQDDLPFGGVGPSGTGCLKGFDGFRNFSHAKAIYKQTKIDVAGLAGMRPPYGPKTENTIKDATKV